MRKFLVTGGAGFIGSHLVKALIGRGDQVVVLDALSWGASLKNLPSETVVVGGLNGQMIRDLPSSDCVLVIGDVVNARLVAELSQKTDACFHLAAETHVDRSYGDVLPFVQSNMVGAYSVLEAYRNAPEKRLMFMSTDEVYGDKTEGLSVETDPIAPRNVYSTLKAGGDILAQTYAAVFGVKVMIARPANNYGPSQLPEKLIPKAVLTMLKGEEVPIFGDGTQVRDWLFVEDCVRALIRIMDAGKQGEIYNVGHGNWINVQNVLQQIATLLNVSYEKHVRHVPDRIRGDHRYAMNWSKIKTELGWAPEMEFQKGLEKTVAWYYRRERLG